mgnify:CR=1 FL=1|jgi:hypothetical protein
MTDHEQQYDPQLEWVIEEVIHAITNKQCTESIWYEVYENIYQTTADDAWDEYQAQQRADAEGEARYEQEQYDAERLYD